MAARRRPGRPVAGSARSAGAARDGVARGAGAHPTGRVGRGVSAPPTAGWILAPRTLDRYSVDTPSSPRLRYSAAHGFFTSGDQSPNLEPSSARSTSRPPSTDDAPRSVPRWLLAAIWLGLSPRGRSSTCTGRGSLGPPA